MTDQNQADSFESAGTPSGSAAAQADIARAALQRAKADLDLMLASLRTANEDLQGAVIDLREAAMSLQEVSLMTHPDFVDLRSSATAIEAQERGLGFEEL